jgi:hypothetical protein
VAPKLSKTGPQKAATVSQRPYVSRIAIKTAGVRNGDARATPVSPRPIYRRRMAAVKRGRRRSKVGAIRNNAKDEQERSAEMLLGRFTALEPFAKGLASTCGDAIAHLMEFAARKNPSRTSKDWQIMQQALESRCTIRSHRQSTRTLHR